MTHVYGCHSDKAPNRCKWNHVEHSSGKTAWTFKFTRACQYDERDNDTRCNGCKQEKWDDKK